MKNRMTQILLIFFAIVCFLTGCGSKKDEGSWNPKDYESQEDIISIDEITQDETEGVATYKIRYKSDDCEVVSYIAIPNDCLENKALQPLE